MGTKVVKSGSKFAKHSLVMLALLSLVTTLVEKYCNHVLSDVPKTDNTSDSTTLDRFLRLCCSKTPKTWFPTIVVISSAHEF